MPVFAFFPVATVMNKRERLERCLIGESTDRVPAFLWRHFPGDDQRASDLARSTVDFQRAFDWDIVKITPAKSFCVADYGVQDSWEGAIDGTRHQSKIPIERSLDWTTLRPLDPARGALGRHLEAVQGITDGLKTTDDEAPIIQTIFSPLAQARILAGHDTLIAHMRTQPERLHSGLSLLTESIMRFIDSLKRLPLAGIFYVLDYADYALLSEAEYVAFGLPYDQKILGTLPSKWWLNINHLQGKLPMFKFAAQLPGQIMNWQDKNSDIPLSMGKTLVEGAVCGGVAAWEHLHQATPTSVKQAVREAITETHGRRLIISVGGATLITSPLSNLRAVREAVEDS